MTIKSNFVKATAAAALAVTGIGVVNAAKPNSLTAHVQAATTRIKINYVAGYGVNIWTNYEHGHFTGKRASHGSTWNVLQTATDAKGNLWYKVGPNQWIDGRYALVLNRGKANNKLTAVNVVKKNTEKSVPTSKAAASIVSLAKSEVGKNYVWGATGPNAFDCSGLVQYVFKNAAGINLSRTTYTQVKQGTTVSMKDLQPGDLLFWGSASAPYHVGIYIGNNQYVHAATPREGVKVQTLSSYFYPSVAKRVLN